MSSKTPSPIRTALAAALVSGAALSSTAWAQDIEVETLRPADPFSIGVLSQSEGGLPPSLWRGSTEALALEALARIPGDSESPAVNRLIVHTLLSGGPPPADADGDALAVARMQALVGAGFAADAARLAARTPEVAARPELAEAQATGELMAGELTAACRTAETLRDGRDAPFWLRLRAVCLAANGETARADLTAQLARQDGRNEQFERAYSLALLGDAPDEQVQTADPLVFAAALHAGAAIEVPANAPRALRLTPLAGLAAEDAALDRLRAGAVGLAEPAAVAEAFEAVDRPALTAGISRLDAALDSAPGAREALLYRLAADQTADPDQRAQAIAAALESAEGAGQFILLSRLLAPAVRSLPVEAGRDDALLLAAAAAVSGDADAARRWRDIAAEPPPREPASADPDAPVALGVREPWTAPPPADLESVDALIALQAEAPDAAVSRLEGAGPERVRFIDAVVLAALGKSSEPELRLRLLRGEGAEGARADADVLLALEAAAHDGAMGETALLAAGAMAPGPGAMAPGDLARILRALSTAGLGDAAIEAGLEAMLAARQ